MSHCFRQNQPYRKRGTVLEQTTDCIHECIPWVPDKQIRLHHKCQQGQEALQDVNMSLIRHPGLSLESWLGWCARCVSVALTAGFHPCVLLLFLLDVCMSVVDVLFFLCVACFVVFGLSLVVGVALVGAIVTCTSRCLSQNWVLCCCCLCLWWCQKRLVFVDWNSRRRWS